MFHINGLQLKSWVQNFRGTNMTVTGSWPYPRGSCRGSWSPALRPSGACPASQLPPSAPGEACLVTSGSGHTAWSHPPGKGVWKATKGQTPLPAATRSRLTLCGCPETSQNREKGGEDPGYSRTATFHISRLEKWTRKAWELNALNHIPALPAYITEKAFEAEDMSAWKVPARYGLTFRA